MAPKEIENLIVKYLTNEATSADLDELSVLIENAENEKTLDDYVKIHYKITVQMCDPDIESIKENLKRRIKKDKNPFTRVGLNGLLRYAAIFISLFAISYMLFDGFDSKTLDEETNDLVLVPREEAVTLQLEDGTVQKVDLNKSSVITDVKGNVVGNQSGNNISYSKTSNKETLVYNVLSVPKGKKFDVVLSDGTHIYLNSASSLRYPVKFIHGLPREVYVEGEAYFDVAKDEEHPFIAHVNDMDVSVLGTKFNVSSYPENNEIRTVLVEGLVKLGQNTSNNMNTTFLEPGFKAEWNKFEKEVVAVENVDTRIYTAWIEGKLIFRNATFKHIRHTLERHYNVTIVNHNKDLDMQRFDAAFDIEDINEVLETFNISYAIEYNIVDNKAIIQ